MDIAGNGKDFPVLFSRQPGRYQGTAFFGCFDNDRTQRHTADNQVPYGEVVGIRLGPEWKFGNHRSGFRNLFEKLPVLPGIDTAQPASQNRYGLSLSHQGALMGSRIDSFGHAADNGKIQLSQVHA